MEVDVIMPRLGLTMEEGMVVRWLKKVGQPVKAGEVIFEVETDKSIQEVESPADGYLSEILFGEGSIVPVAMPVARISNELSPAPVILPLLDGKNPGPENFPPEPAVLSSAPVNKECYEDHQAEKADRGRIFVSWRAKKAAAQIGLDLGLVGTGSGPQGRIIEKDVQQAADRLGKGQVGEWIELTHVQRITAGRMRQSFSEVPHFYLTVDVNAGPLLELRQEQMTQVQEIYGVRLTISDILVKIAAVSLLDHPRLNASWVDGKLRLHRAANIGLATAGPAGLLVPVIPDAGSKTLGEIAQVRSMLTLKARQGRLEPDEMSGGSFTLSNLGMYGIDQFQAIINPPQSAILSAGRIKERPVGENGQVVLKPVFFLTLSCDHRVLDGVFGAAFLGDLVALVENPTGIL